MCLDILTYLHCILPYISTHSTNYLLITFGKPHFQCFQSLPSGLIGAIGTVLMKHVCYCGGQISPINESTMADCFKYTWDGWKKFSTMTKPRAFAASAWVIKKFCLLTPSKKILPFKIFPRNEAVYYRSANKA